MRLYEQIYTSAAELLANGSGNLGVVSQTRDFPTETAGELSSLRTYTMLPGLPLEPRSGHPPRLVLGGCGPEKKYLSISQTVYAGADHTGRTRPLAHHVLVAKSDIPKGVTPARVLSAVQPLLGRTWDGPPKWIEPIRQITIAPGLPEHFPSTAWTDLAPASSRPAILCSAADVLVNFEQSRRSLLICLPIDKAQRTAELIADLLWLLPVSIQLAITAVSHVVESSDYVRDAALLITYPETPFLAQACDRQDPRRPVLLDLSRHSEPAPCEEPSYCHELREAWKSGQASKLAAIGQQWDAMGLRSGQGALFSKARKLAGQLARTVQPAELSGLAAQFAEFSTEALLSAYLQRCCVELVQRLERLPDSAKWQSILSVYTDGRWPEAARKLAAQAIAADPDKSLGLLLGRIQQSQGTDRQALAMLDQMLKSQAPAIDRFVTEAIRSDNATQFAAARQICARLADRQSLLSHLSVLSAASEGARRDLRPVLLGKVAAEVRDPETIATLCRHASDNQTRDPEFGRDVCRQVLKSRLESAESDATFFQFADLTVDLALRCGITEEALPWITRSVRCQRAPAASVQQWLDLGAKMSQEPLMQAALARAGLIADESALTARTAERSWDFSPVPARRRLPGRPSRAMRSVFVASVALTIAAAILTVLEFPAFGLDDFRGLLGERTWILGATAFCVSIVYEFVGARLLTEAGAIRASRACAIVVLTIVVGLMLPYAYLGRHVGRAVESVKSLFVPSEGSH